MTKHASAGLPHLFADPTASFPQFGDIHLVKNSVFTPCHGAMLHSGRTVRHFVVLVGRLARRVLTSHHHAITTPDTETTIV